MNEHPATLLRCVVERITYQNPENGYSVLKVKVRGYNDLVTLVGNLLEVPVGSVLLCRGEWKVDKRYGSQFVAATWEETMPATVYGIEKYLGSGLVKGIGPRFARAIVQRFGTETIDIIETEIERLYEVPNIGRKRVAKIRESWEKQKDIKNVMLFLQGYGVSTAYAAKIYREYGKESIDKVRENPYRLADDIWGIGFKTADGIAAKMGYGKEDPRRCRSGILYTLGQLSDEGHVYAGEEQLVKTAGQLLEAGETAIRDTIAGMLQAEDLILDKDAIYLPPFYHAECGTSRRLRDLAQSTGRSLFDGLFDPSSLTAETGIEYDEVQLAAIRQAVTSKVMVLTGGPGTGKTTTTQGIIAALKKAGLRVLLVEDNEVNQLVAQRILESEGVAVSIADNGKAGWEAFESSAPDAFDAVFMDIQMPVMDGYEATRAIRRSGHARAADIPVIAMTAGAAPEDVRRSLAGGLNDHISNPLDPAELRVKLNHWLAGDEARQRKDHDC